MHEGHDVVTYTYASINEYFLCVLPQIRFTARAAAQKNALEFHFELSGSGSAWSRAAGGVLLVRCENKCRRSSTKQEAK